MHKVVFTLLACLSIALGAEFLGLVPETEPEALAPAYSVIGQTAKGVLVVGNDAQLVDFSARGGKYLAANPQLGDFYRVHLFDAARITELSRIVEVLDFDGQEYIVRGRADDLSRVQALPAMVARISLQPWVLNSTPPVLPKVMVDPTIQAMVNEVSPDSILAAVRRLQNYRSRYSTGDSARAAAQWIFDKFRAYGCDSVYLQPHTTGHAPNVVAIKYGTSGQRQPYAIIDGHFDSYAASNAPGADDNASGTVSAIEAARVTRNYEFVHDMRYIAFSGEEFGLYGSEFYADHARSVGDSILGVFNFDMIAYVDVSPESLELVTKIANPPCSPFSDFFIAIADTYTTLLAQKYMVSDNQNSDHGPFWNNGYLAFCGIEDFWPVNPHYHTPHDSIGAGYNSNPFCTEVIKAGVAALATICEPVPMNIPMVGYLHNRIDDAAGNNNQSWDAGESIGVYLTLKNFGMVAAHNVQATISTSDPYVTLYQTGASFGDIPGQDTAGQAAPYTMKAALGTPREHMASFDVAIASTESTWHNRFSLQIGQYLTTDPVPDGPRTPALYWAYDDVDVGYNPHPTYSWVEINTVGTRISYSQNDEVQMIALPTGFGPWKFYGTRYNQISISADGWVCPGNYTTPNYQNTGLPNSATPPGMICLNWDDLYPTSGGGGHGYAYYYHDAPNHRFIVEYDSVAYYSQQSVYDKFEVIIYDTTAAPPSGYNECVVQYMTANGGSASTMGIEDPTRAIAIQDFYNGTLAHGAAPIAARRAIKYVAVDPTGVRELASSESRTPSPEFAVVPSLVSDQAEIRFSLPSAGPVELSLYDGAGRRLGAIRQSPKVGAGSQTWHWNTRGLAKGVYILRLATPEIVRTAKAVVVTK